MTVRPLTVEMTTMEESPVSGPFAVRFSFSEPVTGFARSDIDAAPDPECVDDQNAPVFCEPVIEALQTGDDRVFTAKVTPQTNRVAHNYTLRTTVYSGEAGDAEPRVLGDVTLEPGGFHQYSGLLGRLGSPAQGYVKVERVEGTAPFHAYGVINDQANSDGSFVFPVTASSLQGTMGQTLPVIVETSEFTSELTVTNFSDERRTLNFQFLAYGVVNDGGAPGERSGDGAYLPARE